MKNSIQKRMILTYVITLLVVILVVGLYLTRQVEMVMNKEQQLTAENITEQISRNFAHFCNDYEKRVDSLLDVSS